MQLLLVCACASEQQATVCMPVHDNIGHVLPCLACNDMCHTACVQLCKVSQATGMSACHTFADPSYLVLVAYVYLQVYRILLKATACVQPVSCDEAYLDVTGLGDPEQVASSIRQQIFDATGCTASAGIGPTMLVARLATKKGKPNGQYRIQPHQVHTSVPPLMHQAKSDFVQ